MRGKIRQIVYELAGYPKGLSTEGEWREAIASGELGRETLVSVYREGERRPHNRPAGEVPELGPLFEAPETPSEERGAEVAEPADAPEPPSAEPELKPEDEHPGDFWIDGAPRPEKEKGDGHDGEGPGPPRGSVAAGIGCAIFLMAGLAAWTILDESDSAPGAEERPKLYRVITPANLRRAASLKGELVRTLRRNEMLAGTLDKTTKGAWLRVAQGEHEGLFIWRENLEPVNLTQEQITNMN